ncbi:hypothetical protein Z517_11510 [Fonsecaea pedrosoi CBS 271.37]|uniref:Unplaced genomic scaffold supercont1.8, whole genome shotgun sequence n=1 Tax=Fonsecaea pedrosoi CBS 271.37 TaxID=1442368 RepID=A0A0D2G7L6_9EURO|nr:uncharacterized protein Z517_11510 [Fonsecaea pedrosoi CBS 271.37]KIW74740.1 hypothetical protein Z517_11510 [Fonsecaea pedrosoi CBS 271.37]
MNLPKPSLSELMNMVKANIRSYRAEQAAQVAAAGGIAPPRTSPLSLVKMAGVSEEMEYTSRTADQEVDTVAICPSHPEYMIIGTYSLLKKDEPCDYTGQTRRGSLQVMTVMSTFKPKYAGMRRPLLDRVDFPCAVLDIRFHPNDDTLLGVATSNAAVHFFRFVVYGDVLGRRIVGKLLSMGSVRVAENDEHGLVPLITQFTWFPETRTHGVVGISDVIDVGFVAATSFGQTRVVTLSLPAVKDLFDERLDRPLQLLIPRSNEVVHTHELEAWTVAAVDLGGTARHDSRSKPSRVILSGGDDSALIASSVSLPANAISAYPSTSDSPSLSSCDTLCPDATPLWKDRRTHTAGVVAILPLSPTTVHNGKNGDDDDRKDIVPLLTGSYDEFIRVFELDIKTQRASFKTDLRLDGGVWRLKVLDEYSTTPRDRDQNTARQHHTLILASLMHAGAAILRVTHTAGSSDSSPSDSTWTITPVTVCRAGHESMVYCCDARLDNGSTERDNPRAQLHEGKEPVREGVSPAKEEAPAYTIVSTSFYDMKICTWKFVDDFKVQNK